MYIFFLPLFFDVSSEETSPLSAVMLSCCGATGHHCDVTVELERLLRAETPVNLHYQLRPHYNNSVLDLAKKISGLRNYIFERVIEINKDSQLFRI